MQNKINISGYLWWEASPVLEQDPAASAALEAEKERGGEITSSTDFLRLASSFPTSYNTSVSVTP